MADDIFGCRAVTSAGSAELIAVSSLFTYDAYRHYFKPNATGKELLLVSKIMILVFTVVMGTPSFLLRLEEYLQITMPISLGPV